MKPQLFTRVQAWDDKLRSQARQRETEEFERIFGFPPSELAGGDLFKGREAREKVFSILNGYAWAALDAKKQSVQLLSGPPRERYAFQEATDSAYQAYYVARRAAEPYTAELMLLELPDQLEGRGW